jgi:hypothetical protein
VGVPTQVSQPNSLSFSNRGASRSETALRVAFGYEKPPVEESHPGVLMSSSISADQAIGILYQFRSAFKVTTRIRDVCSRPCT